MSCSGPLSYGVRAFDRLPKEESWSFRGSGMAPIWGVSEGNLSPISLPPCPRERKSRLAKGINPGNINKRRFLRD